MVGIISNFAAAATQKNLGKANEGVTASITRLSSGNKITSAKDDVAGLAVGTILKTNISSLNAAVTNASQATSMLGVIDGALDNIATILSRQKSLASQATSGSLDATSRGYLNQEFTNLADEIDRIANNTEFNGIKLIDGSLSNGLTLAAPVVDTGYTLGGSIGALRLHATDATAFDLGSTFDNSALIGAVPTITGTFNSATDVVLSMTIGTKTYTTSGATLASYRQDAADLAIDLVYSGTDKITITLETANSPYANAAGTAGALSAEFDTLVAAINTDLSTAVISQTRAISSFDGSGTLAAATLKMTDNSDFNTLSFNDITIAEVSSTGEYKVSISAMGKTYEATTTSGVLTSSSIANFVSTADSADKLVFTLASGDLDLTGKTEQFIADFKASLAGANGAIDFQVGTESTNKISISAAGVKTTNIYKNDADVATTIDITTQDNAETAGNVLDNAINSVISSRANIGALQSRFGYASDNITASIENLDAARSIFLDTDVALESSELAKKQIQVQASISMLAKANSTLEKLAELLR